MRIESYAKMQYFASTVRNSNKYIYCFEEDASCHKEVNADDVLCMVSQKGEPSLSFAMIRYRLSHIFGHGIIADRKTKLGQLALNPLRRPCGVFPLHLSYKFYQFPINICPANSSRFPFPVKLEAFFMPAYNSGGLTIISDDLQSFQILDSHTQNIRSVFLIFGRLILRC